MGWTRRLRSARTVKYLNKRNIPDLPGYVTFDSPPTATAVKWAVIGMLVVAALSNTFSVLFLACWPRAARSDPPLHLRRDKGDAVVFDGKTMYMCQQFLGLLPACISAIPRM